MVSFWGPQIGGSVGILKKVGNLFREKLWSGVFDWDVSELGSKCNG